MFRLSGLAGLFILAALSAQLAAQTPLTVTTAQGIVNSVEDDVLKFQPRGADGKLDKQVALQIQKNVSKVQMLTTKMQGGKVSASLATMDAKDLKRNQVIAVHYTSLKDKDGKETLILLDAIAVPKE
jgi:hypothetical protein